MFFFPSTYFTSLFFVLHKLVGVLLSCQHPFATILNTFTVFHFTSTTNVNYFLLCSRMMQVFRAYIFVCTLLYPTNFLLRIEIRIFYFFFFSNISPSTYIHTHTQPSQNKKNLLKSLDSFFDISMARIYLESVYVVVVVVVVVMPFSLESPCLLSISRNLRIFLCMNTHIHFIGF